MSFLDLAKKRYSVRSYISKQVEKEKLDLIVCADHNKVWTRPFDKKQSGDIDASILTDHMMLAATDLGLGSVWICYFNPDVLVKELNLPENLEPVNILAIGYGDGEVLSASRHVTERILLHELVSTLS